eukprot:Lithocolla_globosa_v1_NODE_13_length_10672_cov_64.188000.p5 type:complete len:234 gc:universal NODE_13_length_10672_cov_64.188000:4399-3698(-)
MKNNTSHLSPDRIRGYDLLPDIYCNVFLCAKKKSGKTSSIFNIIKHCCDKESNVIIFSSTVEKDFAWIQIREFLDKKEIPSEYHTSFHEDGRHLLSELIETLRSEKEEIEEPEPEEEPTLREIMFGEKHITVKKKKPKKISQKYMIIIDDLSLELKDPYVASLLKTNRHFKSKVIISSQWVNDVAPMGRRQFDYVLLFGGINKEKMEQVFINSDLNIEFDEFMKLYKDATSEK